MAAKTMSGALEFIFSRVEQWFSDVLWDFGSLACNVTDILAELVIWSAIGVC